MKYEYNELVYWGNQELIDEILILSRKLNEAKKTIKKLKGNK